MIFFCNLFLLWSSYVYKENISTYPLTIFTYTYLHIQHTFASEFVCTLHSFIIINMSAHPTYVLHMNIPTHPSPIFIQYVPTHHMFAYTHSHTHCTHLYTNKSTCAAHNLHVQIYSTYINMYIDRPYLNISTSYI